MGGSANHTTLTSQRGYSLLELSLVLSVVAVLFVLAFTVRENWEMEQLNVSFVEAVRVKSQRQVPVLAEAVRQWYLHEYCGQGAVDHRKPQLPDGKILACEALPLPPMPRRDFDSFTQDEPDWRDIAPYLPTGDTTLARKDHGYTWEISRPERDPNAMTEVTVCRDTGISGLSDCRMETVPRGPPAMIEIAWSPPEDATIELLEKNAYRVGGTYAPARTVSGQEVQGLAGRAVGRTRLPDGAVPEINAAGVECMRRGRARARVRFPPVPAVAPSEQRDRLRRAWGFFFWNSPVSTPAERPAVRLYNANTDNVLDERDYVLWGC